MNIWAIIPVKPLHDSKSRLVNVLTPEERAALTLQILGDTLEVLAEVPAINRTLVVSRDPKVLKVARNRGASTYNETDKQGLNSALTRASHIAAAKNADCILILPADLPYVTAEDVELIVGNDSGDAAGRDESNRGIVPGSFAICSDHGCDGSNALLVCPPTGFTFQYGSNSFSLHLEEASRLGMSKRVVEAPGIKFDIDTEEDWIAYLSMQTSPVNSG